MYQHKNISKVLNCFILIIASLWLMSVEATENEYRLAAGDRVKVVVFGHDDLSGEYEVDSEGQLSLPLIKSLTAAGLTIQEIEEAITNKLKPDYLKNPRVGVVVLEYRPFYILGEVKNPGSYPYSSNMTVVTAVALAGGFTYRARKDKITIMKASDPKHEKTIADNNARISPGDVIEVPERFF
ncbi:MAG: polysaccharide export protein [Gammaproteobacteria bacterium]|nr:polysaccharide export protein [Gammaproteobacteria bacterium]